MAFYLLTINKSNNSLISTKKKIRKISSNMGIIASLFQPLCIAQSWREPNRI